MTDSTNNQEPRSPERLAELSAAIGRVILGKEDVIFGVLVALFARGHLLIEDIPGVGKTTLAQALASSIRCSFRRIQFTSDLLPSDILGTKIYEQKSGEFKFLPGPIFHCIVLADEINRTTPRTQSALLEAMNESRVTIEGEPYALPLPFMVMATENPLEHHGTYPLPDSQLDRFLMSISVGYPAREDEKKIISRKRIDPLSDDFVPVMDGREVIYWQEQVDKVRLEPEVEDYLLEIVTRTRSHKKLQLGVSPRGSLALCQAAKSCALLSGRDYCLPDDVKNYAVAALSHRIIPGGLSPAVEKRRTSVSVIEEILDSIPVPV